MDRIELIDKYTKKENEGSHPTTKELEEAYGYLNSCLSCGKEFNFWDRLTFNISHSICGNTHRRNCGGQKVIVKSL